MKISKAQTEKLINDYRHYINKIINISYYRATAETKNELEQVGLIGLWKGINAYFKSTELPFNKKKFINTICAYIRFEIINYFRNDHTIKISDYEWDNFSKVKKVKDNSPLKSDDELKKLNNKLNLRLFYETKNILNQISLDAPIKNTTIDNYHFISYEDKEINSYIDKNYIEFIIKSSLSAIKLQRDKELILLWLESIKTGEELKKMQLAKMCRISSTTVANILNKFIDICKFIRTSENAYCNGKDNIIYFPKKIG